MIATTNPETNVDIYMGSVSYTHLDVYKRQLLFWAAYFLMLLLVPAGLYRASEGRAAVEVFA